jgi:penicillin-binding protein 2
MSFHPNEIARRARIASLIIVGTFLFLIGAFFRTQVVQHERFALKSEQNRLREVPLPAPRGIIRDRNGAVIAENVPGYSVSILGQSADSLRATLQRLSATVPLSPSQIEEAVRKYRRDPTRPTVVLSDADFAVISVLEEHAMDFPGLIIQSAPKRSYPHGPAVAAFVGYTREITEGQLAAPQYADYEPGQQIGVSGLEGQYEKQLRGREGTRFVEYDARGREVRRGAGGRQDLAPEGAPDLNTNIDLALQLYVADSVFGDSLVGGMLAMNPRTGEVLALHSAPTFDPNWFIGRLTDERYNQLATHPGKPLYNKVMQGRYPPASTFKLATAIIGMQNNTVKLGDRMPEPCTGGFVYGNRRFKCWEPAGHGDVTLSQAIEKSCDVYFYQLGIRIGLTRLLDGATAMKFRERTGIDLPGESAPQWPASREYFDKRYGSRGWTEAVILNLSIGQGENDQTVTSMARFYSALATGGMAVRPEVVKGRLQREQIFQLTPEQMTGLRNALGGVVSAQGTAGSAQIRGVVLAGKTGTAQMPYPLTDHSWFVGFAPSEDPKILVSVMLVNRSHGYNAARAASKAIEYYLKQSVVQLLDTEGQ